MMVLQLGALRDAENRFAAIEGQLRLHTWMLSFDVALSVVILGKLLF